MQVADNTVVRFHYSLSDADGTPIESSREREPLTVLVGAGNVIPGVERGLQGREPGARFSVTVPPEDGYGARREDFTQRVPKKYFHEPERLKPGMQTVLATRDGHRVVTVLKVGSSVIDVDLNHPMAGRTLNFEIEVLDVREANAEEIAHGHVHGPGGHHHG
jgi:FKBP-type peptidyl-prolyl cis-trans isomerase SlyD